MNRDEILANLAEALELERELGVRAVEIDRKLLAGDAAGTPRRQEDPRPETRDASRDPRPETRDASRDPRPETRDASQDPRPETRDAKAPLPLVFLHDRALSPAGVTMMAKAIAAMHLTAETAPILFTGTRPAARAYVVLGGRALKQWFPGQAGAPGQWITPDGLPNVLVTYSPEYILRFGAETPAVRKLKLEMWTSLKSVMQRLH